MQIQNPYNWTVVNPSLFYGRKELLLDLLGGLTGIPRRSFGIAGGRRMGKTTLLRRIESDINDISKGATLDDTRFVVVYIDGRALPGKLQVEVIWGQIAECIQKALSSPIPYAPRLNFSDFKSYIARLLTTVDNCRFVVLFDEIEPILACDPDASFFSNWRALLSNTPGLQENFTAVFAGAREMQALAKDVGSPLKDVLEWRSLRVLDYDEICELAQTPLGITYEETFLKDLYQQTGGHPALAQYLLQYVCTGKEITTAPEEYHRLFEQWWTRSCTPDAQRIYARLPKDGRDIEKRSLTREFGSDPTSKALEILLHVGIVATDEDEYFVRYNGELFQKWYQTSGVISDKAQHDPQIYETLCSLDQDLADKYRACWQIYQSDLPNYSGAVVEIRGVFEALLGRFAPDANVRSQSWYRSERDDGQPTQAQKVKYIVIQKYAGTKDEKKQQKLVETEFEVLTAEVEQFATNLGKLARDTYRLSSSRAHETSTRDQAYSILKRMESLLLDLLLDA